MLLFLPETSRSIVGNGSVRAIGINKALTPILTPKSQNPEQTILQEPSSHSGQRGHLLSSSCSNTVEHP
jgi:hypothetical protein